MVFLHLTQALIQSSQTVRNGTNTNFEASSQRKSHHDATSADHLLSLSG